MTISTIALLISFAQYRTNKKLNLRGERSKIYSALLDCTNEVRFIQSSGLQFFDPMKFEQDLGPLTQQITSSEFLVDNETFKKLNAI